MAEIITEPRTQHVIHHDKSSDSTNGFSLLLAVILMVVLAVLFIFYGLPYLSRITSPQVNVPGKVDVNVNRAQ